MLFFIITLLIVAVIVILAFVAPKTFEIHKSIVIDRPYTGVFDYLRHIKNQYHWSPWKEKDPNMKQEFIGEDGAIGFIAKWEGNSEVGVGEQEITNIVKNDRIEAILRFYKPWKSTYRAITKVEDLGSMQTKVTWGFFGENKFPANVFMLFYNMDKVVGKDFEKGLNKLKKLLEKA